MTSPALTVAETAARLGCSPDTVLELIHGGELVARKLKPSAKRPTYLIGEEDLAAYWEACRTVRSTKPIGRPRRIRQLPEIANATRYV